MDIIIVICTVFIFCSWLVWGLWRDHWRNLMMSEERSFLKWLWVPKVVHPLLQAPVCVSVLVVTETTYLLLVFKFVWCDVFSLCFFISWYANYSSKLWHYCALSGGGFLACNLGFKFLLSMIYTLYFGCYDAIYKLSSLVTR